MRDLNPQPSAYKAGALPVELIRRGLLLWPMNTAAAGKIKERGRDYKPKFAAVITLATLLLIVQPVPAGDDET